MLNYALIGLGGALGSMLRAWLGTAMAGLIGSSFPWGTILINVIGSFVIGLFAMLTATDGRFALPLDARTFVMVGVCGGFTTFSSFSLQTLELARDGRAGQALGNVALSVLLCLAGVAAGSRLATAIRISPLAMVGAAAPATAGSTTLVALHRPQAVPDLLAAASQLMAESGGRTVVLAIADAAPADPQPTEEVLTEARRDAAAAAGRPDWVAGMRDALDDWVRTERAQGHRARWIDAAGDGLLAVAEHRRSAHLLLLEQRPGDEAARARIHDAIVRARRPVLLIPAGPTTLFGGIVAVAWRDDPDVREAIRAAAPFLSRARRILALHVGGAAAGDGLAGAFAGRRVELVTAPAPPDGAAGRQLVAMAHEAGADLLVMGSRVHGRLHDALFDDVADGVLRTADLPVLMRHQDG